ncbi:MAG TPA: hypothetical protein ENI79_02055 [Rhodospirillales bacterium]|nr:hypothetical protein [Rhodospirillales bacterium]
MLGTNHFSNGDAGVRAIDAGREYMFFVLDRFFHPQVICADPGGTCSRLEDAIHFLKKHQEREERLMIEAGYLGYGFATHKRKHKELQRNLDKMRRTLVCGGYDSAMVADFLTEWMKRHATNFDKPFGDFVRRGGTKTI